MFLRKAYRRLRRLLERTNGLNVLDEKSLREFVYFDSLTRTRGKPLRHYYLKMTDALH